MNNTQFKVGDIVRIDLSQIADLITKDYCKRVHNNEGKIISIHKGEISEVALVQLIGRRAYINTHYLRSLSQQQLMLFEL